MGCGALPGPGRTDRDSTDWPSRARWHRRGHHARPRAAGVKRVPAVDDPRYRTIIGRRNTMTTAGA
jgi:hypothetical protein